MLHVHLQFDANPAHTHAGSDGGTVGHAGGFSWFEGLVHDHAGHGGCVCFITADSILLLSKKAKPTRIDSSKLVIENSD